ncbi:ethanolamine ammonia-lyase heavy chain [Natranaerovirga hydrolytica]|uniref:Ethanolamine ammonia-lyase large subunit n=1 Tax=Natranaerovirga hydrolytica TaxID=680378 RepID=A0A4V2Q1S8_9FIRM|nr:ethanolamine ammonia-lyase subunit EutB [Natranaerovirga hydrolytica]TCK98801.1 ethanolamine ammonia-lyase heavy chain [Natranaerovirga hydrolytica]
MRLKTSLFGQVYGFRSVKEVLAKANEEKSGDQLAQVAAESVTERIAAKEVLSQMTLKDLYENPIVDYDEDEVTRLNYDGLNQKIYGSIKGWTVSDLREWLLDDETTGEMICRVSKGLTSEMIAAITKLMSNLDLIYGAKKIVVTGHCNTTIGGEGILGFRLQPNHPTDNLDGIKASMMEGLSYGVGDALIGLNPVIDTVDSVHRVLTMFEEFKNEWEIPTQNCVLAHVSTQMEAIKKGAPADLIFQSIAGSQKGNEAFGINIKLLEEASDLMKQEGTSTGPNVFYFETGQGSELSSDAHYNADQLTMEARCYGLARHFNPFLVNTVVGFIGPEYLYDSKQVVRAGLEDHFMGKLSGLPMGVDACYTNHMKADQNDIENLSVLLSSAGCNYFMGIPAGDDIMLNYQCTGYHEAMTLRALLGLKPVKAFEFWMEKMGLIENGKMTNRIGDASIFMK